MAPVGQALKGQLPPQAVIYRDISCHRNAPAGVPFAHLSCKHASTGWGEAPLVLYHHPAPLDVLFAADSEQLASVRAQLRSWLRSCDVSARVAQDVLVAVGEAIANAIEHGHRHLPGQQVRLRAVSTADQLCLTVSDTGRWRTSPPGDRSLRGHGISLMRSLMHQVTIVPSPSGTTVDLYLRINHGHSA